MRRKLIVLFSQSTSILFTDFNYTAVDIGARQTWTSINWNSACPNGWEPAVIDNPQKQLDMMRQLGWVFYPH